MKDDAIKKAVTEFSKTRDQAYKKSFSISGNSDEVFTVSITRSRRQLVLDSVSMEARSNTISALPAGSPCGCCNGSGKQ